MAFCDPIIPESFVSINNKKLVTHKLLKHLSNCQASFFFLPHAFFASEYFTCMEIFLLGNNMGIPGEHTIKRDGSA